MSDILDDILDSTIVELRERIVESASGPDFAFNMQTRETLTRLRDLMGLPSEGQVIEELVRRATPNGKHGLELTCSGCGLPYTATRRPVSGKRHYCEKCRKAGEPGAQRARDYRARRQENERP